MINVLISNARVVAVQQKKVGKGSSTKVLLSANLPGGSTDFAAAAQLLRERLTAAKVRDKAVRLILGEQVVFKEFQHQPVGEKAVDGFAHIEAKTVLREQAGGYSVTHMRYGTHVNDAGEQTSMLLAVPTALLRTANAGFGAAGFRLLSVHSQFSCYTATLRQALPAVAPALTGAAIDFAYEATLINLYHAGELVSQRRLPGILECLAVPVMEDTGCAPEEVSAKLAANKFSPAYAAKAQVAITNFTYDILRSLRVLAAPLHITPEQFVLTGAACRDAVFLRFVVENLGLPCVVADDEAGKLAKYLAPKGSLAGLFVLAGPMYDTIDMLNDVRDKQKATIINTFTCAVITGVVLLGISIQPIALLVQTQMVSMAQLRYESLMDVEERLNNLTSVKALVSSIADKSATLGTYNSNAGATLPRVLQLFTEASFTLEDVAYAGEEGAYQVTFLAATKEDFLRLKDRIYADGTYYLNLSMSIVRQTEEGSYLCQLYFIPADYIALPKTEAPESTGDEEIPVTQKDVLEEIG